MSTTNLNTLQPNIYQMVKRKQQQVRDLGGKHTVTLKWDQNEAQKLDRVFCLSIGDNEAYIDLEELQRVTRVI